MQGLMMLQPTNDIVGKQSEYKTTEEFVHAVKEEYDRDVETGNVSECYMRYYPKGTEDSEFEWGKGVGIYQTTYDTSKGAFKVWIV